MSESIGFEPVGQLGRYGLYRLADVAYTGAGPVQCCRANPNRQALIIDQITTGTVFRVTTIADGSAFPAGGESGVLPAVIHAAVYPILCQGVWYIAGSAPSTYAVYEVVELFT